MKVTKSLSEGNIYKSLFLYALPLLFSSILSQAYSTVDAIIAGKFISEFALGAISATSSFETLLVAIFGGFAGGFSVYVAQLFGRGDHAVIKRDVVQMAALVAGATILVSTLAILFRDPLFDYLKVDPILRDDAERYFILCTSGYVLTFVNSLLVQCLHALGITSFSLYVSISSAILNIGGNLLSVVVFDLGVAGLALSTILSTAVATVFYVVLLRRAFRELDGRVSLRFSLSGIRYSFRYTVPASAQQVAFHGVTLLIAPVINGLGAAATTGYTVSHRFYVIASMSLWAMTSAFACYTAQCVGERSYGKIRKGLAVGFLLNAVMMLPFVLVLMIFARPLASMFFPSDYVAEAYEYAVRYATVFLPFLYVQLVGHILHSYMRCLGRVTLVLVISLFGSVIRYAFVLLLTPEIGMDGIFLSQILGWVGDMILSTILYLTLYRTPEQIRRTVEKLPRED